MFRDARTDEQEKKHYASGHTMLGGGIKTYIYMCMDLKDKDDVHAQIKPREHCFVGLCIVSCNILIHNGQPVH